LRRHKAFSCKERPLTIAEAAHDPTGLAAWICILLGASLLYDVIAVATAKISAVGRARPFALASSCGFLLFGIAAFVGWYRSALEGPFLIFFLLSLVAYVLVVLALHIAASLHDAALSVPALPRAAPTARPAPLRAGHAAASPMETPKPPAPGDVVALNSGGPPMTVSSVAAGASEAVLLWFERGRCLEVKLPLAAVSVCRPFRSAEWPNGERLTLYAIDSREEAAPSLSRRAEPSEAEANLARIAPPELVSSLGPVASTA